MPPRDDEPLLCPVCAHHHAGWRDRRGLLLIQDCARPDAQGNAPDAACRCTATLAEALAAAQVAAIRDLTRVLRVASEFAARRG